tara:strand:+ start:52 stop:231 length:180 start_codon:yes stop_codon:yes gene_type:complete
VVTYSVALGVLGIKVSIMLDSDPQGLQGPKKPQPDCIRVLPPKEEEENIPGNVQIFVFV